jgi:hypothetical protein
MAGDEDEARALEPLSDTALAGALFYFRRIGNITSS